jgi:hypothetical protein
MHLIPSLNGGGRTETQRREIIERVVDPQQVNYITIINK